MSIARLICGSISRGHLDHERAPVLGVPQASRDVLEPSLLELASGIGCFDQVWVDAGFGVGEYLELRPQNSRGLGATVTDVGEGDFILSPDGEWPIESLHLLGPGVGVTWAAEATRRIALFGAAKYVIPGASVSTLGSLRVPANAHGRDLLPGRRVWKGRVWEPWWTGNAESIGIRSAD